MGTTNVRIDRAQVYIGSKLIVEISNAKYGHNTGDDQGDGFNGSVYFTTGNDRTTLDFDVMVPKKGVTATALKQAVINHSDVQMAIFVDGGIERIDGRLQSRDYDWESKSGMLKCSYKFIGSKPQVT